jgi:hypothetical protein
MTITMSGSRTKGTESVIFKLQEKRVNLMSKNRIRFRYFAGVFPSYIFEVKHFSL